MKIIIEMNESSPKYQIWKLQDEIEGVISSFPDILLYESDNFKEFSAFLKNLSKASRKIFNYFTTIQ